MIRNIEYKYECAKKQNYKIIFDSLALSKMWILIEHRSLIINETA